jgi:DNA-directed RNA polymerase subunit E'/Rpb7
MSEAKTIGPYFNTTITTTVGLHPNQMTKKIYENLKSNIIKKYEGRNFGSIGYISKIYNITKREGGLIVPENQLSTAIFKVEFLCKLCRPLRGTTIICEVQSINKIAILLKNGPINVYIFLADPSSINRDVFSYDDKNNVIVGKVHRRGKDQMEKILVGSFVNVRCIDTRIEAGRDTIIVLGIMDSVTSESDKSNSIIERESDDVPTMDFQEYINNEREELIEMEE